MQEQHQDPSWARGVGTSSQIPHQVLGAFPAQLSDADYDQLSRFPAFDLSFSQLHLLHTYLAPVGVLSILCALIP